MRSIQLADNFRSHYLNNCDNIVKFPVPEDEYYHLVQAILHFFF